MTPLYHRRGKHQVRPEADSRDGLDYNGFVTPSTDKGEIHAEKTLLREVET
jgi:hypothetical protein